MMKIKVNENYSCLKESYLFSEIGKKVRAYQAANPDKKVIRLGIGDVTLPLAPVVATISGASLTLSETPSSLSTTTTRHPKA